MSITEKLITYLSEHDVKYERRTHAPSETCELSAKHRGEDIKIGGKTLLFKSKHGFHLFSISAEKGVDNAKVRKILKSKKLRFASSEELMELCGVVKGALPPLGNGFYPFDHYVDESIFENEKIAFNAGDLSISIIMDIEEYKKLIDPVVCKFSKDDVC